MTSSGVYEPTEPIAWGVTSSVFLVVIAFVILFAVYIIPLLFVVHQWKYRKFTVETWLLLVLLPWVGLIDTLFLEYREEPRTIFGRRTPAKVAHKHATSA